MRAIILSFIIAVFTLSGFSQQVPEKWLTYYEKSGFLETPRYAGTVEYCRRLEKASPWIKVVSIGKTPEGRDLIVVIASKEKAFDPLTAHKTGKAILLVQNGIHAGEIDGKDACLMLLRDIAITKTKAALLDHTIFIVIPIFNIDGHERFGKYNRINQNGPAEMGWRVTAQNLNLNRDYMKADAPEMQSWLKLYTAWLPDFFIDAHVTDGADYQHIVTYGIEAHSFIPATVRSWLTGTYLPVLSQLKTDGIPVAPYIFLRDDTDPSRGMWGGTAPPRFSTNYVVLQNRPGLLIETHMLKPYKQRVDGTYRIIETTLEVMNKEYASLTKAVRDADEQTVRGIENPYPLQFRTLDTANTTFHYLGIKPKVDSSDISGATRIQYTGNKFEADLPRFDSIVPTKSVIPPYAYLIPQQWQTIIARLKLHGLILNRLKAPVVLSVESYRFSDVKWQQRAYEGRHPVSYTIEKVEVKRTFPAGTVVVRMNQRAARVAIHALEPDAPDAFVAWGFMDAIFEQKEYAEGYVMEPLAREMLAKDDNLKREFEAKLQSDTAFAKSPDARLNFFYQHSPWWDEQVNLYPIARLLQPVNLDMETLH